ncbi:PLP-dependent aminotransferase family protein [Paenibacillus piri]|uniref:PLP-dependent aminotransferase family protein n=1 Tax=Paenibacillus piri TaxID=2547395 RepID=A0A4R5KE22_9BACL|nr:PLP-dependent aminotransferase family protein [Paenibacillus piri]TDF92798.1 PLP-dependent aminotransferase family protein [Paenibacillus piri]
MYGIHIDTSLAMSVTMQLCNQLRRKIESGELAKGTRLPPTRRLAQEFGIARNVVIDAYEQLTAEGYVTGKVGSGTYVAAGISTNPFMDGGDEPDASPSGRRNADGLIDFTAGTPDLGSFPRKVWARYLREAAEYGPDRLYDYGDIRGEYELRTAIASYLFRTRGMRCHPDRIMIVSGSADGLALAARALYPRYRSVYIEDPTIELAQHIFRNARYNLVPVEVDRSGMNLQNIGCMQEGHLLLLTPSHHFPCGSILSIQRRQLAVKMAEQSDTYVLEDDYDGDFRLKGIPVPPLYTLAPERVIYFGTFSKTLAPGLRIGFVVVPKRLAGSFAALREDMNLRSPSVPQIALARFISDGRLDRHIHKMKGIYRHRRNQLVSALQHAFGDGAAVFGDEAGMHVMVEFISVPRDSDWRLSESYGVRIQGLEDYALIKGANGKRIVLGYGHLSEANIKEGVDRIRRFIAEYR